MLDHIASLILLLLAAAGLFLQSGITVGKPRKHMFAFYTNVSNLAVLIYELIFYFTGLAGYSGLYAFVRAPVPRYIMALAILVTNIIYHFFIGVSLQFAKGESDRKTKKNWLRMLTVDPILCGGKEKYEDALKMNKAREDVYYSNIKLKKTIESKDREIGLLRAELDKYTKTEYECDDSWID